MNILGFRILISTPSTNSYLHIVIWGLKLKIKTDFRLILKRVCFSLMYTGTARPGVFYLSSPAGAAWPFHQLSLPCVILLTDGPIRQEQNLKYIKYIIYTAYIFQYTSLIVNYLYQIFQNYSL